MDTLNGIACFVRSAESGSFAEAARRLGLTPAAVGKNVARLESELGVRLFQRSTRRLHITEAGEQFLGEVAGSLAQVQAAMAHLAESQGRPAGTLKVSMGLSFGRDYVLPMLDRFLQRHPGIVPDWHFDNRQVDLVAEGFDAAVGGGFDLPPGVVARELAPAHRVLLAEPGYLAAHTPIRTPADLARHDGILLRSPQTGRVRPWRLRDASGAGAGIELRPRLLLSDPEAACRVARMGLGVTLVSMAHALPYLDDGSLARVLPGWYVDTGAVCVYYPARRLLPAKTRAFVEALREHFRERDLVRRLSAIA